MYYQFIFEKEQTGALASPARPRALLALFTPPAGNLLPKGI